MAPAMAYLPILDLSRQHGPLRAELLDAIASLVDRGHFVGGAAVARFEEQFAAWHGRGHCVGVGNATDGLAIALRALGIGPGDEVIVPAMSFFATAEAVSIAGATPIFCDIDATTANIDPGGIEALIGPRTRAILPVHLYGQPAALDAILEVANRNGLPVVEDCAQAVGAKWRGRKVGTYGALAVFSFYPSKNLGAFGDAGAILTDDGALAEHCRMLASHGGGRRYEHRVVGINSRLDAIQAAVLSLKLPHLDAWNAQRCALEAEYRRRLVGLPVEQLATLPDAAHVHHLKVVLVRDRDRVRERLHEAAIATDVHYPEALPLVPAYASLGHRASSFPAAARLAAQGLTLPLFPGMRDDELDRVVVALGEALGA